MAILPGNLDVLLGQPADVAAGVTNLQPVDTLTVGLVAEKLK